MGFAPVAQISQTRFQLHSNASGHLGESRNEGQWGEAGTTV
jgi:hypothetical protein